MWSVSIQSVLTMMTNIGHLFRMHIIRSVLHFLVIKFFNIHCGSNICQIILRSMSHVLGAESSVRQRRSSISHGRSSSVQYNPPWILTAIQTTWLVLSLRSRELEQYSFPRLRCSLWSPTTIHTLRCSINILMILPWVLEIQKTFNRFIQNSII